MQVSGIDTVVGLSGIGGMSGIPGVSGVTGQSEVSADLATSATSTPGSFASLVGDMIERVQGDQLQADEAMVQLSEGNIDNLQQVVMSVAKADLSFRFFLEMRNKLTESYQELSRMQF